MWCQMQLGLGSVGPQVNVSAIWAKEFAYLCVCVCMLGGGGVTESERESERGLHSV